jgi:hypothetical protein
MKFKDSKKLDIIDVLYSIIFAVSWVAIMESLPVPYRIILTCSLLALLFAIFKRILSAKKNREIKNENQSQM